MSKRKHTKRRRPIIKNRFISSIVNFIFKLLPFIAVIAIIGISIKIGLSMLYDSDYFKIKSIRLSNTTPDSSFEDVLNKMDSKKGENIFEIDLQECKAEIASKHPELKDIKLKRLLPDIIDISYKTRKPFCQVDFGYFYLVSEDMVILSDRLSEPDPQLPVIVGIEIPKGSLSARKLSYSKSLKKAISILKEIEESGFLNRHKVTKLNVKDLKNPAIFIDDDTKIEIGEYSFRQKQRVLEGILDELESKNKTAKVIDLRFEDVVVVPA